MEGLDPDGESEAVFRVFLGDEVYEGRLRPLSQVAAGRRSQRSLLVG